MENWNSSLLKISKPALSVSYWRRVLRSLQICASVETLSHVPKMVVSSFHRSSRPRMNHEVPLNHWLYLSSWRNKSLNLNWVRLYRKSTVNLLIVNKMEVLSWLCFLAGLFVTPIDEGELRIFLILTRGLLSFHLFYFKSFICSKQLIVKIFCSVIQFIDLVLVKSEIL